MHLLARAGPHNTTCEQSDTGQFSPVAVPEVSIDRHEYSDVVCTFPGDYPTWWTPADPATSWRYSNAKSLSLGDPDGSTDVVGRDCVEMVVRIRHHRCDARSYNAEFAGSGPAPRSCSNLSSSSKSSSLIHSRSRRRPTRVGLSTWAA